MKKFFRIFWLALLAIAVIGTMYFLWKKSRPVEKKFVIEQVTNGNIEKRTVATGKVEPRNEILIKPQMSGIVAEVYKEAGDKVQAGDIIAKIKVIPDMVSLNAAESRVQLAQLSFNQSKRNYDRDSKLFKEKVIAREEFEKSELQYFNNQEELKTAKDNLSLTRDGVSTDKAQISNTLVRSTINGTILNIPVKVGNSVIQSNNFNDGTTIATVANMNDMLFVGKLDETEVGRIKTGMPMDITIGAVEGKKLLATLEYVSPKGVEENGAILFEMKAAIKVPSDVFVRAGYSANAEIVLSKLENVRTVPESCIEFSGDTAFVYLLKTKAPQTFTKKHVKTGLSDGMKIEIKSGVKLNDKIRGAEILVEKKK
ncbi:MAG: efflux transporter periplasmic adaptor subunit [Porphyromonadaceae bacterium CG2_30_38_12]|nr:MAG: efflux transporter periplasmic adaptor subunit [Porphyromonadaceae bacterium CG2_30_38_12]